MRKRKPTPPQTTGLRDLAEKLAAMIVERGCTPAEAETAARLLAALSSDRELPDLQAVAVIVSPTWIDVHEAKRASGLGRSTLADLVSDEKIRSSKVGKRRLIHLGSLLAYIEVRAVGPVAPTKEPEQLPAAE